MHARPGAGRRFRPPWNVPTVTNQYTSQGINLTGPSNTPSGYLLYTLSQAHMWLWMKYYSFLPQAHMWLWPKYYFLSQAHTWLAQVLLLDTFSIYYTVSGTHMTEVQATFLNTFSIYCLRHTPDWGLCNTPSGYLLYILAQVHTSGSSNTFWIPKSTINWGPRNTPGSLLYIPAQVHTWLRLKWLFFCISPHPKLLETVNSQNL